MALATFASGACSEAPSAVAVPDWARQTSWNGSVMMQTGAVLEARFFIRLPNIGGVAETDPARLTNPLTSAELTGFGSASYDQESVRIVFQIPPGITIDPLGPACGTPPPSGGPDRQYVLEATLAGPAEFQGTLRLRCLHTDSNLDVQPLILRKL